MKTKAISSAVLAPILAPILARCRETAMALGLGLALAIPSVGLIGAGWVHAQTPQQQSQQPHSQAASLP